MGKLKIAFVRTNFPTPGGLNWYNKITGLIDLGHEVKIFALSPGVGKFPQHEDLQKYNLMRLVDYYGRPKSKIETIKIVLKDLIIQPIKFAELFIKSLNIKFSGKRNLSPSSYFLLKTFSKYNYFDFIYGITGPTSQKVLFLKEMFPNAKFIANFVGFDFSSRVRTGTNIYKDLFKKADLIISLSYYSRDCIISLGCPENKIIKHTVGIDISKFAYKERIIKDNEAINLITVGRLVEKKVHRIILYAISNILKKGKKLIYHIVGDGPLLQEILKQIEADSFLKKHVIYHGYKTQNQVAEILQKSHVFIQPSITTARWAEQEDTPTTLLEAQATGMPVIATYHAGIPEIVINKETGLLVPERNIHELEKAIEFFIDNPTHCQIMGKKARTFVEDNFDVSVLNKKLEYIFYQLKEGKDIDFDSTEKIKLQN